MRYDLVVTAHQSARPVPSYESWMGILKTEGNEHPWDSDLYGPNGWDMPAAVVGGGDGE